MSTETQLQTLNFVNVFRSAAIIWIVAGHTIGNTVLGGVPGHPLLSTMLYEIFSWGTTLFVFIAGYLFEYLLPKYEYKKYLKKKWLNVISPYLIWSIPGIIALIHSSAPNAHLFKSSSLLEQAIYLCLTGGFCITSWFIPMISIFFLCAPLLIKYRQSLYLFLPVLLLYTVSVDRITFFPLSEDIILSSNPIKLLFCFTQTLFYASFFLSIYVLGMFCAQYRQRLQLFMTRGKMAVLLCIAIFFMVLRIILTTQGIHFSNGDTAKIFLSVFLILWLDRTDYWFISHAGLNKVLNFISQYSFGIFFVHPYILSLLLCGKLRLTPFRPSSLPVQIMTFIAVLGLSLFVLYILKLILIKLHVKNTRCFIGV